MDQPCQRGAGASSTQGQGWHGSPPATQRWHAHGQVASLVVPQAVMASAASRQPNSVLVRHESIADLTAEAHVFRWVSESGR